MLQSSSYLKYAIDYSFQCGVEKGRAFSHVREYINKGSYKYK